MGVSGFHQWTLRRSIVHSKSSVRISAARRGWSMIDVAIAVTAFAGVIYLGTSEWLKKRDRDRLFFAANHLADIHRAQRSYHDQFGCFASRFEQLDLRTNPPIDFDVDPIRLTPKGWTVLARRSPVVAVSPATDLRIDQDGWGNLPEMHAAVLPVSVPRHRSEIDRKEAPLRRRAAATAATAGSP